MENSDLTPGMQEMMAAMAAMRAELNELKTRTNVLTHSEPKPQPPSTKQKPLLTATSRRKALSRIGSSLIAAGLASSLPLFTTSAAPDQQTPPPGSPYGPAGPLTGPGTKGVNPNATPNVVTNGAVTQTFIGYDFKPVDSGSTYTFGSYGGIYWTGTGEPSFWCRMDLPQGAKVIDVTFYFTDNDAVVDLAMGIDVIDPLTHGLNYPVYLTSSGASTGVRTVSATGTAAAPVLTVDNSQFSYGLYAVFSNGGTLGSIIFWGARVTYVNVLGRFQAA